MWAIRNQHADPLDFDDPEAIRAAIRAAYDDGFTDAANAGVWTKASALVASWCEGAKFALRAIAKHELCFLSQKMLEVGVKLATDACVAERERLTDGVRPEGGDADDVVALHSEIYRLRAELDGPDGFATWKDAAVAERVRRVEAERKFGERPDAPSTNASLTSVPAWRAVGPQEHPVEKQMREEFESRYGDMSGVMMAVNRYSGVVERFRSAFNSDLPDRVTNADLEAAEKEMLANVRAEARWLFGMDEANGKRLDFVVDATTTWYPGRARDGSGRGILCFEHKGRRAESEGMTMVEAIDAAMRIVADSAKQKQKQ
jgi:hypothetical protein